MWKLPEEAWIPWKCCSDQLNHCHWFTLFLFLRHWFLAVVFPVFCLVSSFPFLSFHVLFWSFNPPVSCFTLHFLYLFFPLHVDCSARPDSFHLQLVILPFLVQLSAVIPVIAMFVILHISFFFSCCNSSELHAVFRLIWGFCLRPVDSSVCFACNLAQKLQPGAFGTFVSKVFGQKRRNYQRADHIYTIVCRLSDVDQYLA